MFPPEVVFCQVAGGVGRRTSPPPLASNYLPHFCFPKGGLDPYPPLCGQDPYPLKTKRWFTLNHFFVFHGGCQTGFRQRERQGMCTAVCVSNK